MICKVSYSDYFYGDYFYYLFHLKEHHKLVDRGPCHMTSCSLEFYLDTGKKNLFRYTHFISHDHRLLFLFPDACFIEKYYSKKNLY